MKKIFSILSVNILVFIILICALICYLNRKPHNYLIDAKNPHLKNYKVILTSYPTEDEIGLIPIENNHTLFRLFCGEERIAFNQNKTKNPIVILGCSYAYGHGLKKEESFGYLLSDLTDRPVYSFASCGGEAFSSLEALENIMKDDTSEIKKSINNSDYVIYVYMYDHIVRYLTPNYIINHYDELFEPNKIERFFIKQYSFKYLMAEIRQKIILHNFPSSKKAEQYMKKVLEIIYKNTKKYTPNAKFIFIIYDEKITYRRNSAQIKFYFDVINSPIWQEFAEENNVTVIHTKDLMGFYFNRYYKLQIDISEWHPNARAWKEFTPMFAKEYIH